MTDAANLTPIVRLAPAKLNLTLAVVVAATTGSTTSIRCSCRSGSTTC